MLFLEHPVDQISQLSDVPEVRYVLDVDHHLVLLMGGID